MGMRRAPKDVHREVLKRDYREFGDEPSWYAVWLGPPHGELSELLGRAERLPAPRWWRAYPVSGEYPARLRTFNVVIKHLLQVREDYRAKVCEENAACAAPLVLGGVPGLPRVPGREVPVPESPGE